MQVNEHNKIKRVRDCLLPLLFLLAYILTDICFRKKYLVNYSHGQVISYIVSLFFPLLIFVFTVTLMTKNGKNRFRRNIPAVLAALYFSLTIVSSYVFVSFTGIFPNYYTLAYLRNEPANTISLIIDSIHIWQMVIFAFLFILLVRYFIYISGTETVKKISGRIKPAMVLILFIPLLAGLVINIHRCDQCMIVDANFTAAAGKHITEWNTDKKFSGDGLPGREPVQLGPAWTRPRFNVIIVIFESLRPQNMHVYGYARNTTPFLSSLAKLQPDDLYIFNRTYTVSTTTMLAVPAILSGVTPEQPVEYYSQMPLAWEYAKMTGYHTFFTSSQSMQWYRFDKFYGENVADFTWNRDTSGLPYFNDFGIDDRVTVETTVHHVADIKGRCFFGVVQFNATHYPYRVPEEYAIWNGRYIDRYDNSVLYQDALLEKLFAGLSKAGVLKNTVIIMVGDHGEAFKEHNTIGHVESFYAETVSVPLIIYIPGAVRALVNAPGLRLNTQSNTSNADILPTVIDILGLKGNRNVAPVLKHLTGRSLSDPPDHDRHIITTNRNGLIKLNTGISLIKRRHHYILRTNIVPYCRELYNMENDPMEYSNIIKNTGPELINELENPLAESPACREILDLYYPAR